MPSQAPAKTSSGWSAFINLPRELRQNILLQVVYRTEFDEATRNLFLEIICGSNGRPTGYKACYYRYQEQRKVQRNTMYRLKYLIPKESRQIWEEDVDYVVLQWTKWFDETFILMLENVQATFEMTRKGAGDFIAIFLGT